MPDASIPESFECLRGKGLLFGFELLQANDIGLCLRKPGREILQPFVDVVDVESSDFQCACLFQTIVCR